VNPVSVFFYKLILSTDQLFSAGENEPLFLYEKDFRFELDFTEFL